jgi:hypothetical protein
MMMEEMRETKTKMTMKYLIGRVVEGQDKSLLFEI